MDEATGAERGRRRVVAGALVAFHVGGFAASSTLIERVARRLPGFETSRLAEALERAGDQASTAAGGVVEWSALVFREALIPAAWEELLFRGLVYAGLSHAAGPRAAVLGSALLFGAAHGDLHHGCVAALLGLPLGCLRTRHGLVAAWIAHAANNLLAFSDPAARALSDDVGLIGVAIALAWAGSSNAILLQAMGSGESRAARGHTSASGDGSV